MNPFTTFSDVLFTCIDAPRICFSRALLEAFNTPNNRSLRDRDGNAVPQFFTQETPLEISLAYSFSAERNTTLPQRAIIWEPGIHAGKAVLMSRFRDGMSHSIFRLSERVPYSLANVRIHRDEEYPGVFFDYYSDHRTISRRIFASKDERGWDFAAEGPVQWFENESYYARRAIKDRLTSEVIAEFLAKLGFSPQCDGFWTTDAPATLFWQSRPDLASANVEVSAE